MVVPSGPPLVRVYASVALTLAALAVGACSGGDNGVPVIRDGVVDLRGVSRARNEAIPLRGSWAFYWKELQPAADLRPAAFGPIDQSWTSAFAGRGFVRSLGFATYRVRILLPEWAGQEVWGVRSGGQASSLLVRVNGVPAFASGRPASTPGETIAGSGRGSTFFSLESRASVVVDAVVANHSHPKGGAGGTIMFGTARQIEATNRRLAARDLFVAVGLLLFGVYHLGMFVIRRQERVALYFGLFCLIVSVRTLSQGEALIADMFPGIPFWAEFRIGYLTYFLMTAAVAYYVHSVFPRPRALWLVRSAALLGFGFAVLCCFPVGHSFAAKMSRAFHTVAIPVTVFAVVTSVSGFIRREPGSFVFLAGILLLAGAAVHDILENLNVLQSTPVFSFALMLFVASQSLMIYGRFSRAFSDVEFLSGKLRGANAALERLSGVKDEFMANLSHELRTPLTLIRGSAEMLAMQNGSSEPIRASTQRIIAGSDTLIGYVDDLILVTDVETVPEMHQEDLDLSSLTGELLPEFAQTAMDHGVEIEADLPGLVPIRGDRRLLRRALQNLIKNAIMYNRPQGRVFVRVFRESDSAVFEARDTGIGIASGRLSMVWEKFTRVEWFHEGGVGLGLFLTRKVIELHGGTASLVSTPGEGSTATLRLPLRRGSLTLGPAEKPLSDNVA